MGFSDAQTACKAKNGRLPTVNEFIQFAEARGAVGRITLKEVQQGHEYKWLSVDRYPLQSETIYYSIIGYQYPFGELGSNYFWTSDFFKANDTSLVYIFNGSNGKIGYTFANYEIPKATKENYAVRCIYSHSF